jgi:hypothetical protein
MDPGEYAIHMIGEPVVASADPFDPESRTAELPRPGGPTISVPEPADPLVPASGSGLRGWAARAGAVVLRHGRFLVLVAAAAALPMHFFVGRVDDTVVAAPALSDLLGGVGLLLLPLMWLAYFAVSALPLVLSIAGTVGVVLPAAADGRSPGLGAVWRLVAYRLRPLWLWFAAFGVVSQALPLVLTTDRLGAGGSVPLVISLGLVSTTVLTVTGMLGCVVLIERGHGPRRALHLLSLTPSAGLIGAALALTALPRLAGAVWGSVAGSAVGVVLAVLWSVAALVTYAQARRAEGPVTSVSLRGELATPDIY